MAFWQKKENRFYSELISHTHTKKKEKKEETAEADCVFPFIHSTIT